MKVITPEVNFQVIWADARVAVKLKPVRNALARSGEDAASTGEASFYFFRIREVHIRSTLLHLDLSRSIHEARSKQLIVLVAIADADGRDRGHLGAGSFSLDNAVRCNSTAINEHACSYRNFDLHPWTG